jgi:ATP-dependent RNA helicase DDX10/DBP4
MVDLLSEARIPLRKVHLNPKHQVRSCKAALQSLLSREVLLKQAAQKAVVSYVRSVFLQPNKVVHRTVVVPIADGDAHAKNSSGVDDSPPLTVVAGTL